MHTNRTRTTEYKNEYTPEKGVSNTIITSRGNIVWRGR